MRIGILLRMAAMTTGTIALLHHASTAESRMPYQIEESLAAHLVIEAHEGDEPAEKSKTLWYQGSDITFSVYAFSPQQHRAQKFAVNLWTGDVWDEASCTRMDSPALRESQERVRVLLSETQSDEEHEKLRLVEPDCTMIPFKIDEPTAGRLASEANYNTAKDACYFDYEGTPRQYPFFSYDELGKYEGSVGFFSVNPWTGDVWGIMGLLQDEHADTTQIPGRDPQAFHTRGIEAVRTARQHPAFLHV